MKVILLRRCIDFEGLIQAKGYAFLTRELLLNISWHIAGLICRNNFRTKYLSSSVFGFKIGVPGLEFGQTPPGSTIVKEAASASITLQPLSLPELTASSQASHIMHEA